MDRLVKQLITPFITEQVKATKVIAVYPGRFQPFGPHHKKVFQSLQKKFDIWLKWVFQKIVSLKKEFLM